MTENLVRQTIMQMLNALSYLHKLGRDVGIKAKTNTDVTVDIGEITVNIPNENFYIKLLIYCIY